MPAELSRAFYGFGFAAPTPIQAQVWPVACQGLDVIGIARTGSGKTLAYLYPAYLWMGSHRGSGVRSLILAPTRELATQIHEEAAKFAAAAKFTSACVYGGVPKKEQLPLVRAGAPILVATPGRLNDFLESRQISLQSVGYLVFDEADRMLDMGFEPQIRDIVKQLPRRRQTLMFSATWPEEVQALAHDFLQEPIHIQVGDPTALQANEDISQQVVVLTPDQKDEMLLKAVRSTRSQERVLVFVAMKKNCDLVARTLRKNGVVANAMHSDKDQQEREEALQQLRSGAARVLVATDVAARGLDVKGIALVVNYDPANSTEDHVHRIGRTGRAGQKGRSMTFLTRSGEDAYKAVGIAEVMEKVGDTWRCVFAVGAFPRSFGALSRLVLDCDITKVDRVRQRQAQARQSDQRWEVLMVAEKPSVAKLVAELLAIRASPMAAFASAKDGRPPDLADLFYANVKKTVEGAEHIQELASEAEYLALWLDCDREGENICYEAGGDIALQHHPGGENVYRAHFSALTQTAFKTLGRPDKQLAMAVDARQELDLKIGVTFTRLMTRTFLNYAKEKFRVWDQTCLSYGPCQTPTLWFCVERHKEIEQFQRQDIFTPTVNIEDYPVDLSWEEDEFSKGKEWRLYDYVTRHFIASLMDDAEYDAGFTPEFHASAVLLTVREPRKLEEIDWQMPDMAEGDQLSVDEVAVTRDTTKNVVDRHYVMICGPGADGQRGEVISKGGKGKGRKGKGKGAKGEDGRPASRHMVPTPMGLSLLAAFEELDAQLCRPPIRAFMEKQVAQIAEGLLDKPDVTAQNLDLFHSKFLKFRDNISSLDRFFMRKDQMAQSWSGAGQKRQGESWGGENKWHKWDGQGKGQNKGVKRKGGKKPLQWRRLEHNHAHAVEIMQGCSMSIAPTAVKRKDQMKHRVPACNHIFCSSNFKRAGTKRKQSIARNPQPCAAASGPIGPMLPSVAAIPSSSGGLLNASFSCPPQPLHRLAGEWRLFVNSGAVRDISISAPTPYAAVLAAVSTGAERLPSALLRREFATIGLSGAMVKYTEAATDVLFPGIGVLDDDKKIEVRRYRIFSRFCQNAGMLKLEDLEAASADSSEIHLQAVALRRGPSLPDLAVPFVVPGHLFVQAIYTVQALGLLGCHRTSIKPRLSLPRLAELQKFGSRKALKGRR
ncbi:RH46 [Symbiodinium microadriaticum]|nr:RH46 [Symbiodinium microadriaticum]